MKDSVQNRDALLSISPTALSTYAQEAGWRRGELYRKYSNVFFGDDLPDIIIPNTTHLADYASVVAGLIQTFAELAEQDEFSIYRVLSAADRDILRIRAQEQLQQKILFEDGLDIVRGTHELLTAAACSVKEPLTRYFNQANQIAREFMNTVRMGAPEEGSFVFTLTMPPLVSSHKRDQSKEYDELLEPISRTVIRRLVEALSIIHRTATNTESLSEVDLQLLVSQGVNANFCEALNVMIRACRQIDIGVTWARTRPLSQPADEYSFQQTDSRLLVDASKLLRFETSFRDDKDVSLNGFIRVLERDKEKTEGLVRLVTTFHDSRLTVHAKLKQHEYERALLAHKKKSFVTLKGNLHRVSNQWRLLDAHITETSTDDGNEDENTQLVLLP